MDADIFLTGLFLAVTAPIWIPLVLLVVVVVLAVRAGAVAWRKLKQLV